MQLVQELGFKEIHIEDDLLTLNHAHVHAICDEIVNRGLKIKWNAFSRVDTVDRELLKKDEAGRLRRSALRCREREPRDIGQGQEEDHFGKGKAGGGPGKRDGHEAVTSFILGLPGETKETMRQSYDFANRLNAPYCLHVLAPFPGTEVREKAEEYGITILTDDWSKYDANRVVTTTPGAGAKDVEQILHQYYSDVRRYNRHQERQEREGRLSDEDIQEMRRRRDQRFAWSLLKNDCIENLGPLEIRESPTKDLGLRLAERLSLPLHQVEEQVARLEAEGLLVPRMVDGRVLWSWSGPLSK